MPEPSLSQLASAEFTRRQLFAQAQVDAGTWSRARADAALRPWLAIALWFGTEPTETRELLAEWRGILDRAGWPATAARALAADDICPRAEWLAELHRAADAARAAHVGDPADEPRATRAQNLALLAMRAPVSPASHPERNAA